jgi:hypothetical protein
VRSPLSKTLRRFFQFRLRTLLVFTVLCSFAFAWVGAELREWQEEREALLAIGPAALEYERGPGALPLLT